MDVLFSHFVRGLMEELLRKGSQALTALALIPSLKKENERFE